MTSELTVDFKFVLFIFSKITDLWSTIENFLENINQVLPTKVIFKQFKLYRQRKMPFNIYAFLKHSFS